MSTNAEPEATTAKQDTASAFPFRVKPGDLVLCAKITLRNHEGLEVVDVDQLLKIDSVLGEFAYVTALRRIERALEFAAITSFQVQVAEMLQKELVQRKRIELAMTWPKCA